MTAGSMAATSPSALRREEVWGGIEPPPSGNTSQSGTGSQPPRAATHVTPGPGRAAPNACCSRRRERRSRQAPRVRGEAGGSHARPRLPHAAPTCSSSLTRSMGATAVLLMAAATPPARKSLRKEMAWSAMLLLVAAG